MKLLTSHPVFQNSLASSILSGLVTLILIAITGALTFAQTGDRPVAVVNGRSISENEVETIVIAQTLPLEEKLYAIRKAALENLITTTVLEIEAKKRGVSVGELRRQLAAGDIQVTPSEVENAYSENASFFASMSPDEAKERLRLDLENQKRMDNYRRAVLKIRQGAQIDLFISEPRLPKIGDLPPNQSFGPLNAPITIVEFSDFQCPYCRSVQLAIKKLLQTYPNDVKLVFKHLPLPVHEQAFSAALSAFCAGEQSRFWQFHDALFASDSLTPESLKRIAKDVQLDLNEFEKCLASAAAIDAVRSHTDEARRLGINSTPTFVINQKPVRGAVSFEQLKTIVVRELQTAGSSSRPQLPQPARKD